MKLFFKFTFEECKAAQLALMEMERDIKRAATNPKVPWNPDARETQRQMLAAARSAIQKLSDATGIPDELGDGEGIDPSKYMTKPS